jgi:2-amino-4-hydroxy-6-hydroxymethyldihydropteridine diphosphokinase
MMTDVFIGVGSNLGDREQWLQQGVTGISTFPDTHVVHVSPWIETSAWSSDPQPPYLNGVIWVKTQLSYRSFFDRLVALERQTGRISKGDASPRNLDLDILGFGDQIIDEPDLKIPHPQLVMRSFVLIPFVQICPTWMHPVFKQSIYTLYLSYVWGIYEHH